jgi:hypothetical protein
MSAYKCYFSWEHVDNGIVIDASCREKAAEACVEIAVRNGKIKMNPSLGDEFHNIYTLDGAGKEFCVKVRIRCVPECVAIIKWDATSGSYES